LPAPSGKVAIIARFYDPSEDTVQLDDEDIRDLNVKSL
jgi:ABC-type multidrug transport system fused ATPase/permease subunit